MLGRERIERSGLSEHLALQQFLRFEFSFATRVLNATEVAALCDAYILDEAPEVPILNADAGEDTVRGLPSIEPAFVDEEKVRQSAILTLRGKHRHTVFGDGCAT